jgi:hypothetical protein
VGGKWGCSATDRGHVAGVANRLDLVYDACGGVLVRRVLSLEQYAGYEVVELRLVGVPR